MFEVPDGIAPPLAVLQTAAKSSIDKGTIKYWSFFL